MAIGFTAPGLAELEHTQLAKDPLIGKTLGASLGHHPIRRRAGAVRKICRPAFLRRHP